MAFKKSLDEIKQVPIPQNRYLYDSSYGLKLIAEVISGDLSLHNQNRNDRNSYRKIDRLLDKELIESYGKVGLSNELEIYSQLASISDKLKIPYKYRLLNHRTIVGIGGMFSSGKSFFINSLLGENSRYQLPVAQSPSTSVPTYIINGEVESAVAVTLKGDQFSLDEDALAAISHGFQDQYGIGLGKYLSFISIQNPNIKYQHLAILDTPGYNKADTGQIEAYSDLQKAYGQLRTIDYLIWVVDVNNGTINQSDIQFIKNLGIQNSVLIVVTKCDTKPETESMWVSNQIKADAKNAGLNIYDVVRYNSMDQNDFDGKKRINGFLDYAQMQNSYSEDISLQFKNVCNQIEANIISSKKTLYDRRTQIGNAIIKSNNINEIRSLVQMYSEINIQLSGLDSHISKYNAIKDSIERELKNMTSIAF